MDNLSHISARLSQASSLASVTLTAGLPSRSELTTISPPFSNPLENHVNAYNEAQEMVPALVPSSPHYMAICTDSTRCGASVYSDSTIQLVADRRDSGDPYKGLDIIIQRVDPELVIVSSVQKKVITFLERKFRFEIIDISKKDRKLDRKLAKDPPKLPPLEENNDLFLDENGMVQGRSVNSIQDQLAESETCDVENSFKLVIVPNNWFSISKGVQLLLDSEWVKAKGIQQLEERLLFVQSRVKTSTDICSIRAISALNIYLNQSKVSNEVEFVTINNTPGSNNKNAPSRQSQVQEASLIPNYMPIIDVKYIETGPVLSIDKSTMETLGIFGSHSRESLLKSYDTEKESEFHPVPTLYDILNQCQSSMGRKIMRTMMMWPLQDINELRQRHETLDYFIRAENRLFLDQLVVQLKNIIPLASMLTKLSQSVATYKELFSLYKSLWSAIAIIDLIKSNGTHNIEILQRVVDKDQPQLRSSVDSIMNVVDFEASKREHKIQVCLGVNEGVDEKKDVIKNLTKFLEEVGVEETVKYKEILGKTCRVLYIPRIGFLNSIDYTATTELQRIQMSNKFDVLLHTEQSVYFKTQRMEELDRNAGDIACDLIDMQESVIVALQNDLLKHTDTILSLMELCGELDCLIAFASVSFQRNYVKPEMVLEDQDIFIKQAYHPLHSLSYNAVPNDVQFYKDVTQQKVKVMLITGPNSCGKTTYMKATCLVVYMAHIGCFVPASYARLPVVDAILTRMHSANSISTGLSTFASDLHQVNYALARATKRSLIAIDEFGKGTQTRDGYHLLKGLVAYFAVRTVESPCVMIATHFNRIIDQLQNYNEYILYKTFKVQRDPAKDTILYQFQLMDGVCDNSFAHNVAAKAGIPYSIIERAKQVQAYIIEGRPIRARPPCGA